MEEADVIPIRLEAFLAEVEPDATDISVTNYESVTGGYSRDMGRFDLKWRRAGRDETHTLICRSDPPPERAGFHTDRRAEWDILTHLASETAVAVPTPRWFCDGSPLGTPSILMDYVPSTSLLLDVRDRGDLSASAVQLAEMAAAIHTVDTTTLPSSVVRPADGDAYLTERISAWATTERAQPESDPFLRYVGAWLAAHRPPPVPLTLIHGDFQSANLVVCPDGDWVAVDWEFARIGDPREDLGYFRGVAAVAPPDLIGGDAAAFCARYRELTELTEGQLNPQTIRYFTILGMATVLGQILDQKAALGRGELHSISGYYVSSSISFAHMQQLAIIDELEDA